ncbi:MAG: hypothetical protein KBD56_01680 [Candidatus Eisenbacteria bacterium]|nr:hypothetical protein [Candidatus Eisenbacteria bacterium]
MRTTVAALALLGLLMIASIAVADPTIFFEEQFNGPTLDPTVWRTEVLTSGPRWCQETFDYWGPGSWVDEGVECHDIAISAPYGSASLSDGWLHFSSTNERAYPMLYSRLPGSVQVFPTSGDFSLTLRLRYDYLTNLGCGLVVFRAEDTEPVGDDPPHGRMEDIALHMGANSSGFSVATALGGSYESVECALDPTEAHEFKVEWVGSSASILADGEIIYGPVTTSLRPTAVLFGNHPLYWYLSGAWTSWSLDEFRVEVEGPVPVVEEAWGAIKAKFRN